MSEASDQKRIAALLREREGYVRFDNTDRLKAVDDELKRLGHKDEKSEEPKKRVSREAKQSTADDSKKRA